MRQDNAFRKAVMSVAMLAAAACFTLQAIAQERPVTDRRIADAVEDEFLVDRAVPLNEVDVSVNDGVVTLEGSVSNVLARERAARVAETVKGVVSVVNLITVEPYWNRQDWEIENDVAEALLYDTATESWEIDVEVTDNRAVLSGTVESFQEKQLAAKVTKGVRGVKDVENNIDVDYETDRPDEEIASEIESALRWDRRVDDALIDVAVDDGEVTLSGVVGSSAERRVAREDAWVAGVVEVDTSDLDVERWARDEDLRVDKYTDKSDSAIETAVEEALVYDPRVGSYNVNVDVDAGIATLRGEVDNLDAKRAAESVARRTVGVVAVKNRIKVRPEPVTDREIAQNVQEALARDPYVERFDISVSVSDGTVYLRGSVDSYFEKSQADNIASRAEGVVAVRNNLTVERPRYPMTYDPYTYDQYPYEDEWYDYEPPYTFRSDAQIKENIQSEFFWSPFVDGGDIDVSVKTGVATLEGTVDSISERQAATENAYEGGATWVENELEVE